MDSQKELTISKIAAIISILLVAFISGILPIKIKKMRENIK